MKKCVGMALGELHFGNINQGLLAGHLREVVVLKFGFGLLPAFAICASVIRLIKFILEGKKVVNLIGFLLKRRKTAKEKELQINELLRRSYVPWPLYQPIARAGRYKKRGWI